MIKIVQWDDWQVIYKDDKLVYRGHGIDYDELLKILGVPYQQYEGQYIYNEDLDDTEASDLAHDTPSELTDELLKQNVTLFSWETYHD